MLICSPIIVYAAETGREKSSGKKDLEEKQSKEKKKKKKHPET